MSIESPGNPVAYAVLGYVGVSAAAIGLGFTDSHRATLYVGLVLSLVLLAIGLFLMRPQDPEEVAEYVE